MKSSISSVYAKVSACLSKWSFAKEKLKMNVRRIPRVGIYAVIRLLSLVALAFASALAVDYYFNANTFCSAGAACDAVAKSEFGQKYGIFLPTLGLVAYTTVFFSSFYFARTRRKLFGQSLSAFWFPVAIFGCAVGAMLFIYVQAREVKAFCWLCMGIDSAALAMVIPGILLILGRNSEIDEPRTRPHWLVWAGLYVLAAGVPLAWGTFQPPATAQNVPELVAQYHVADKINIVEISSFDCPRCRELHPELSQLIKSYGDKVNFERVMIPLDRSRDGVIAYLCAERQDRSESFADRMFKEPTKEANKLREYAVQCELDASAFDRCIVDPELNNEVDKTLKALKASDFRGAPTVWVDDIAIVGYRPEGGMDVYRNAIDKKDTKPMSHLPIALIACLVLAAVLIVSGAVSGRRTRTAS